MSGEQSIIRPLWIFLSFQLFLYASRYSVHCLPCPQSSVLCLHGPGHALSQPFAENAAAFGRARYFSTVEYGNSVAKAYEFVEVVRKNDETGTLLSGLVRTTADKAAGGEQVEPACRLLDNHQAWRAGEHTCKRHFLAVSPRKAGERCECIWGGNIVFAHLVHRKIKRSPPLF